MKIIWTNSQFLLPGLLLVALVAVILYFSYRRRASMPLGLRWLAATLKIIGCLLLLVFILEPKKAEVFNPPGVNRWAILVDTSSSMKLKDQEGDLSRADRVSEFFSPAQKPWEKTLGEDFIIDSFSFNTQLRPMSREDDLSYDGAKSKLGDALEKIQIRYQDQPLAGVLVITDGSPTDAVPNDIDLPPVYPLVITPEKSLQDLAITNVTAQESLFEDAPLIIDVSTAAIGLANKNYIVSIHEIGGGKLMEKSQLVRSESDYQTIRFQLKPKQEGITFLEATVTSMQTEGIQEATLDNNSRLLVSNRDSGPYRVLYMGGRPNYEHKFLQRALEEDASVRMTSLIRIAKREPKFDYRGRSGEKTNPLYRGAEVQEEAERFDEAVFLRLNTKYPGELAGGFPRTAKELFPFEAVIIDDVEAEFFDREQMRLLQRYVSERGGSLLMLGGMESLDAGAYDNTPIGELLPVYLEPGTPAGGSLEGRFKLTREGELEPWVRLRQTNAEEKERIERMPTFSNVHALGGIRPGAMSLAFLETDLGKLPGLVTRRYGDGRSAVLALSDFWRWGLENKESHKDLDKSWRQLTRWLLADVPSPLSVRAETKTDVTRISTKLLGEDFKPKESGALKIRVKRSDKTWTQLSPKPDLEKEGVLEASYKNSSPGAYLAEASIPADRDLPAMKEQIGWVVNSIQDEYLAVEPDMEAMNALAESTNGEVITIEQLEEWASSLDSIPLPIEETRIEPYTNSPWWLLAALLCFIGEWALRRWKKLL